MGTIRLEIKREITIGRCGGSLQWTANIVMLICELLVNGTPTSSIPSNIQTISASLTGSEVNKLPSLYYVNKCCVVVQNLNDILAACRPVKVENWHQIFTAGTTRSQIIFQNLVIFLMTDSDF